jgi:uncharacterized protein YndB with AHSA1/START domain
VYEAWTSPELLRRWWGPGEFTCPEADIDLRAGGAFRLVMQPPGGGDAIVLTGTYREVSPPARLVYTWRWAQGPPGQHESLVTVEFQEREDGTEVVVVHDRFAPDEELSQYRFGWESGLDKLSALLGGRTVGA